MMDLKFNSDGLIPAIAQDYRTGAVLMQAYMNEESIKKTLETGKATYFSRSRNKLWMKGEESGHFQTVKEILVDCDGDCLLLKVDQTGPACHTNHPTCFFRNLEGEEADKTQTPNPAILYEVYNVICDRLKNPKEGSYTNYLFEKGIDKMCKKVGEEAAEVIIGAKNRSKDEVTYEVSDLFFHVLVVMKEIGVEPDDIFKELQKRR
jgi:phosphoribosyl-ATP pyrophosphohydrolase/phosphoribosyl-AMP cyclohydrolase